MLCETISENPSVLLTFKITEDVSRKGFFDDNSQKTKETKKDFKTCVLKQLK